MYLQKSMIMKKHLTSKQVNRYIKSTKKPVKSSFSKKPVVIIDVSNCEDISAFSEEKEVSDDEEEVSEEDTSAWHCDTCNNTKSLDNGDVCDDCVCGSCGMDKEPGCVHC
jgi:hypothetical protein